MGRNSDLPDEVKVFIVQRLACWDTPTQVSKAVKEEFGLELPRQNIATYDPTVKAGRDLSKKLRILFEETRKAFTEETASIGIAHKAVRLRRLDRMSVALEDRGNIIGAAALIEQAAKEAGGVFTNKQEISGPNGTPIAPPTAIIVFGDDATAAPARKAEGRSGDDGN